MHEQLIVELKTKATAVYLATHADVANDLADVMHRAADKLEKAQNLFKLWLEIHCPDSHCSCLKATDTSRAITCHYCQTRSFLGEDNAT